MKVISEKQTISRRENEGIVIGDDIFVTVLKVRLNHVLLGISCPRRTPSYWEETLSWEPEESESSDLLLTASRF
ncbi:MAG: carbon storage regulator [Planctomycetaceae bacterium]